MRPVESQDDWKHHTRWRGRLRVCAEEVAALLLCLRRTRRPPLQRRQDEIHGPAAAPSLAFLVSHIYIDNKLGFK